MIADFTVAIDPHGKGRPRATSVGGKARMFTPSKTRKWERAFSLLAKPYQPEEVITGPIRVSIRAEFARPKYMSKRSAKTGEMLGGFGENAQWMTARPDADNVAKSVLDALAHWYKDDAQVVALEVVKVYHAMDSAPSVRVTIRGMA